MHFRYDWPEQNVSRETLVKFYASRPKRKRAVTRTRTMLLLVFFVLAVPFLDNGSFFQIPAGEKSWICIEESAKLKVEKRWRKDHEKLRIV